MRTSTDTVYTKYEYVGMIQNHAQHEENLFTQTTFKNLWELHSEDVIERREESRDRRKIDMEDADSKRTTNLLNTVKQGFLQLSSSDHDKEVLRIWAY